jgi:hypothetical protein
VFVVVKLTSTTQASAILGGNPGSVLYWFALAPYMQAVSQVWCCDMSYGTAAPDTNWRQANLTIAGNGAYGNGFRINEAPDGGTSSSHTPTANTITVGSSYGGTYFGGYVAEILIYNTALSLSAIEQAETYLNGRYGI